MSTPSQQPTPTGHEVGTASSGAETSAEVQSTDAETPRSPAQDRRVSIGIAVVVVGVIAALVFDLALSSSIPPLAASLITLIIGVVGGAVLGRPSRGRG